MIDLRFASGADKAKFNCETCRKNPSIARVRKCDDDGYENMKSGMQVDKLGPRYPFCPGKATWSEEMAKLFEQCMVAVETGILPETGGFYEQDGLFIEVFPTFVERWKARKYADVWSDVRSYVEQVLKAIFGKGK